MVNKDIKYFRFHANCILVKANTKCALYDLQLGRFFSFDIIVHEVFSKSHELTIRSLKDQFEGAYSRGIDEYINFFIKEDIGFITDCPDEYPALSLNWENPFSIINCIIERQNTSYYDLKGIIDQLGDLYCPDLQFRLLSFESINELVELNERFLKFSFRSIELFVEYSTGCEDVLSELLSINPKINGVFLFDENSNATPLFDDERFHLIKKPISITYEEYYSTTNFMVNVNNFTESQNNNLGLNRKISISKNGDVLNYLSHDSIFGNVNFSTLQFILKSTDISQKWKIENDRIEICRECLYRYACLSNSDIYQKSGKYYKNEYCNESIRNTQF